MYYSDYISQKEYEKLMQYVRNFSPRGHGSFVAKAELTQPQSPAISLCNAIKQMM